MNSVLVQDKDGKTVSIKKRLYAEDSIYKRKPRQHQMVFKLSDPDHLPQLGILFEIGEMDVRSMWKLSNEAEQRIRNLKKILSPQHKEEFLSDLTEASLKSLKLNSNKPIAEILEAWDATAEILLDEEEMEQIKKAEMEFKNGETVKWDPSSLYH